MEGGEKAADRRISFKKGARITDFCDNLNGSTDFENTAVHGSAVNFGLD